MRNADETPIWFDLPLTYTVTSKGDKQVPIKTTGNEQQRITCTLAITADGEKLPPFLIFKRKTIPWGVARSNILQQCLQYLHETSVTISSLTFDRNAANMTMTEYLGANLDLHNANWQPWFQYPCTDAKVFICAGCSAHDKVVEKYFR
ncbi:hypothetical protein FOCC_FOCC007299 [Frankliniella occidentalis]|nr:hypothetical protein FOCC_FOCC007299 [Frankliniella occidentalis]